MRTLLLLVCAAVAGAQDTTPLVVLLGAADRAPWQRAVAERGWRLAPPLPADAPPLWTDAGALAVETLVQAAPEGALLVGLDDGASAAFYLASRLPDLWRAVLAIGGTPKVAVDSNRFYAGNTRLVPIRWIVRPESREKLEPLASLLRGAGANLEFASTSGATLGQALDWLQSQRRDALPLKVDCETGSGAFRRCYWVEMAKIDAARRNDALPSSRVSPGAGASLACGPFGFDPALPGPGVVVGWLPEGYRGPLKLADRIVSVAGQRVEDAHAYVEMMDRVKKETPAAVTLLRGRERLRLETRIRLPQRDEVATARVQAEVLFESREIQVVSRAVAELRLRVPPAWVPVSVNWNGLEMGKIGQAGCWRFTDEPSSKLRPCTP